jgi:hypothetical protein
MSVRTDQLRQEAEQARKDLVGIVGELGTAVNDARDEAIDQAKRIAPIAGAGAGGLVLLKLLVGRRRRR